MFSMCANSIDGYNSRCKSCNRYSRRSDHNKFIRFSPEENPHVLRVIAKRENGVITELKEVYKSGSQRVFRGHMATQKYQELNCGLYDSRYNIDDEIPDNKFKLESLKLNLKLNS